MVALTINNENLHQLRPSKRFRVQEKPSAGNVQVTSLDFDDSGTHCIASISDDTMRLIDCRTGRLEKASIQSKKYGCHNARFTRSSHSCVFASTKLNDTIRYLDLNDNRFIRYFIGHKALVTALEVSPTNDTVLSASKDGTVRLWDLRSSNCHGVLSTGSENNIVAIDPTGLVYALGSPDSTKSQDNQIGLYDIRMFDRAPFASVVVDPLAAGSDWLDLEFGNDSETLMLSTKSNSHYIYDSSSAKFLASLTGHGRLSDVYSPATYSANGKFVFTGGSSAGVYMYDLNGIKSESVITPECKLQSSSYASTIKFNPKLFIMATADSEVEFWTSEK